MDKLAKTLAEQFNCTVEYAKQHLPGLMHDYCMYHGMINLITAITSVVLLIACAFVVAYMVKSYRKCCESGKDTFFFDSLFGEADPNVLGVITTIALILCVTFSVVALLICIPNAIEALCFPDVYMMEKVLKAL